MSIIELLLQQAREKAPKALQDSVERILRRWCSFVVAHHHDHHPARKEVDDQEEEEEEDEEKKEEEEEEDEEEEEKEDEEKEEIAPEPEPLEPEIFQQTVQALLRSRQSCVTQESCLEDLAEVAVKPLRNYTTSNDQAKLLSCLGFTEEWWDAFVALQKVCSETEDILKIEACDALFKDLSRQETE